jgi:hypothetical protein
MQKVYLCISIFFRLMIFSDEVIGIHVIRALARLLILADNNCGDLRLNQQRGVIE